MTTTDISKDAGAVDSSNEAGVTAEATEEAKQILARSRYEAFRLVTEARNEAETILDGARTEAAGTVKAAVITAESKVDAAEVRATQIVQDAESRAQNVTNQAQDAAATENLPTTEDNRALEAEHEELAERVNTLRTLADKLEDRFAALAAGASTTAVDEPNRESTELDYSPSVQREETVTPDSVMEEPIEDRGSFYARRSAKLPSIGAAGGQSALDMTRSIRSKLESGS